LTVFKKLAGQTAIYGLSSIVGRFLYFLLVPIYTRVFHAGEYGEMTQLYAYVTFLNVLFTYGLETAYFRFFQSEKANPKVYSTALISIVLSSLGLVLIIVSFSGTLAEFITAPVHQQPNSAMYVCWFALILAFDAIMVLPFAKLRVENKAKRFASLRIFNIVINIGLNLFFLIWCPKAIAEGNTWVQSFYSPAMGVGYVFFSNVISSGLTLLLMMPEIFNIKFQFDSKLWKQMIIYAFPLMIAGYAGMVNETFDRILLPYLLTDKSQAITLLGIYGACYKLSMLMTLVVQTFRYAADPFFFSLAGKEDAQHIYARVMNYFVLFCSFVFLGILMYLDIFKYFIGEDYRSGLGIVPILLLANLFLGVYLNLSIWYKITSKTRWGAWFSVFGAVVTLLLNFLLIPIMGFYGSAWATFICYGLMMVASYIYGQKHYPVPYDLKSFAYAIGSVVLFYFISLYFAGLFEGNRVVILLINTVLLLSWLALTWVVERKKIAYLRSGNNSH